MTALAVRRRGRPGRGPAGRMRSSGRGEDGGAEPTLFDESAAAAGDQPTLDAFVSGLWDGLVAHRRAACPLCGGEIRPGEDASGAVVVGRCGGCDTTYA